MTAATTHHLHRDAAPGGEPLKLSPPAVAPPTTGEFLEAVFLQLQREGIEYAVLRNYDGLPQKPGRDIDILTNDYPRFAALLREFSGKAGYSLRIFRRYVGMVKFHLARWCPGLEVLEIDVAWSINWKGIPFFSPDLLRQRLPKRCFFILPPGAEAALSLIKHVIYHGTVLDKYKPWLPEMARSDRAGFLAAVAKCFGNSLAEQLFDLTCQSNWQGIASLAPQLRRNAILRTFIHNPLTHIIHQGSFIWWNLRRFFRPSGRFVVLLGPDGSGKSTISQKLQEFLQPLFQGHRYFHGHFMIIPRLRDVAMHLGFKLSEPDTVISSDPQRPGERVVEFGTLRSLLYLFYQSLGYLLGYGLIFRARGRGELLIFDRYYYDYLIQPGMSLPPRFIKMVLSLLPKPDLVVYLRNDPHVIFSRKPELTLTELTRQSAVCAQLMDQLTQGYVVDTIGTPDETAAEVAKLVVSNLFNVGSSVYSNPTIDKQYPGMS
jgi:thymidylate kinase